MSQDSCNDGWVVDHGDQPESPATAGTGEDVQPQAAAHQIRPERIPSAARVPWRRRLLVGEGGVPAPPRPGGGPIPDHERAPGRPRAQDAVIQQQVDPRPWCQRREALQQFDRVKEQMGRPVRPRASQRKPDLAVVGPLEALLGHRRPQGVAGDPLQPIPLIGGHANAGMQIEAPGEREESGDPRRSLEERYTDHAGFVEAVSRAAARSVVDRTLLEEDAATIITIAEESDILRP